MRRSVPIAMIVALAVLAGAFVGGLIATTWRERQLQREWELGQAKLVLNLERATNPRRWKGDSLDAHTAGPFSSPPGLGPREVRRLQAANTCVVSLEIRDSSWGNFQLFTARAWHRMAPGQVVAEASAYREQGLRAGDTVTVVFPNVECGEIISGGYGGSVVRAARPELPGR